jgi:predicted TIM-barrel fold metal-dependent hydrolase
MLDRRTADSRYVLISTDCHAGADLRDYKPYLERRWHEEFDRWADSYFDLWGDIDTESEWKAGVSSYMSPLNWESQKRLEALEVEGIAAEVIFPNTVPPFFPNGALAAPGPRGREEYERRWAGIKAHNRWLKDFCDQAPGRRFGYAQLLVDDIDEAVAEIRWAKEAGMRGVLLPSDHHLKLHNLYYARYDPIWAVCEELSMPVGRHGSTVGSDEERGSIDAAHACGLFETLYFAQRTLFQLIFAGVFERYPGLKFAFTEVGTGAWVIEQAATLDLFVMSAKFPGTLTGMFAGKAVARLSMLPSEYCKRNVWVNSLLTGSDVARRDEIGMDRLMWGADFPHHEGTAPFTKRVLRGLVSSVPEDELRRLLAGNAAELYGADLGFLQGIADRVGPSVAEIATPLRPEEVPDDINFAYLRPEAREATKRTYLAGW